MTPKAINPNYQLASSNDEAIDLVLAALRDTPTPHGMERRILNVLEAETLKSAIPSGAQRSRGISALRNARAATISSLGRWTAIAGVTTLALVAIVVTLTARRHTVPTTAANPTPSPNHALAPAPQPTATATTQPTPVHHITAPTHPAKPHPIEVAQSDDQQISHPAPPIPLTDQEKLLLRYARRGRSDDLAEISNDRKAAKEEQEAAEFQAFFEPIRIGESE